ncbi:ABC transporter ATP-binding protein [Agrococcus sediminis]|uniref:ABC transporter ATP-binding protein n=1 Tax=Agrococcus sediminis TaxID=2599924 RepID=UPI0038009197
MVDNTQVGSPILHLRGITKSFGGIHVLKGIDLAVERGSIQGLIGPNGSGKSTLFDIITGYQKPDDGVVEFVGEEINGQLPHVISRAGLIRTFQLTKVFPNLTVAENLLVFASGVGDESKKDAENRAVELLDFVHLIGLHDREASTLSYGQLKLLEFAQVLMHRPQMLLLDEPFAGVNPGLIDELVDHIREMRKRGLTILLVEHNLPIVAQLCDRVAVVSGGQIAMNDVPEVVVNDPDVKEVFLGDA